MLIVICRLSTVTDQGRELGDKLETEVQTQVTYCECPGRHLQSTGTRQGPGEPDQQVFARMSPASACIPAEHQSIARALWVNEVKVLLHFITYSDKKQAFR